MAQIIRHRRGSLESLSAATSSFQKGELIIVSGSSNITTTNGSGMVFAAVESGSVQAVNRFLVGNSAPNTFASSTYNGLVKGVPYYASGSSTLYLLGSDGNDIINLVGNIQPFSQSVHNRLDSVEASIGGFGTGSIGGRVSSLESYTGSYATTGSNQFNGDQSISGSVTIGSFVQATTLRGTGSLYLQPDSNSSNYLEVYNTAPNDIHIKSSTNVTYLGNDVIYVKVDTDSDTVSISGSAGVYIQGIDGTISDFSQSVDSRFSASAYDINSLSASVASVTGDFSSSVATSFSASAASQLELSSSVATSFSASEASITALSASVASVTGDFSSSVATSFSASAASVTELSSSVATAFDNVSSSQHSQDVRIDDLSSFTGSYATTGSNIFYGTQVFTGSLYVAYDLIVQGSSSLEYITASQVELGTNRIILNNDSPAVRFGGISVQDSGSAQGASGSLLWDSLNNNWIYQHPSGGAESGMTAILISGPKNSGSMGDEAHITPGKIMVAVGDDHIGDSIITQKTDNSGVIIDGGLGISGSMKLTDSSTTFNITGNGFGETYLQSTTGNLVLQPTTGDVLVKATNLKVDGTISGSIEGIGNVTDYSASVSASIAALSASVGSGAGVSISNLNSFSASAIGRLDNLESFSSSVETQLSDIATITGSLIDSASTAKSTNDTQDDRLDNLETTSGSVNISIDNLNSYTSSNDTKWSSFEAVSGSYATTGSNTFTGNQTLTANLIVSGTTNFNNAVAVNNSNMNLGNSSALNLTNGASIYVDGSGTISGSIVGIGNVTSFSSSVDQRINDISGSLGSGGALGSRVAGLEALTGSYATTGSNTFTGDQNIGANQITFDGGNVRNNSNGIELYSNDFAQLQYDGNSYVWVDSNGVHFEANGNTIQLNNDGELVLPSFTLPNASGNSNQVLVGGSGTLSWADLVDSASVATSFSQSAYDLNTLSASVASVTGDFSSSVATSFSASAATVNTLSSSISDKFDTLSIYTSSLDSKFNNLSSSVDTLSSSFDTRIFNVSSSLDILSGSVSTLSSSFDTRITNVSTSVDTLSGSVSTLSSSFDTRITNVSSSLYTLSGSVSTLSSSVDTLSSSVDITISNLSSSINTRITNVSSSLSTLSGSVWGLSSSLDIRINNLNLATESLNTSVTELNSYTSSLKSAIELTGSNVVVLGDLTVKGTTTSVESSTIQLGDNIIELNGTGVANGGLLVKDPTSPNTASGSLLWDSTNDYWKAGTKDSESKILVAGGDNVVTSSAQILLTQVDGFSTFDTAISTSFSQSAYDINSLSASVASVTGDFSSSVATSFSQSTYELTSLSASVASVTGDFSSSVATSFSQSAYELNQLSASVASVTGDFSSSVATSFSASAASVTELSSSFSSSQAIQDTRLDLLEISTGSLNSFTSSIDTTIKTKLDTENVVSSSIQIDITQTTGFDTFSSSIETRIQTIDGGTY